MKALLFAIALLLGGVSYADQSSAICCSGVGTGVLFQTGTSTAVTYTASTTIPKGSVLKKLIFFPNTSAAGSITVTAWDAVQGITGTTGSRKLLPTMYQVIPSVSTQPYVIDFTVQSGSKDAAHGVKLNNFLVLATEGTNTPNAVAEYEPGFVNKTQGTTGAN